MLLARGLMHRHRDRVTAAFLLSPAAPADAPVRAGPPHVFAEDPQFDAELTETERAIVDLIHVRTLPVLHLLRTQALPGLEAADHAFLAKIQPVPASATSLNPHAASRARSDLSGRQEPTGHKHICDLLADFPRATCAILDRTGHLLFAEQPALLTALATEWLDRVEEVLRGGPQSPHN